MGEKIKQVIYSISISDAYFLHSDGGLVVLYGHFTFFCPLHPLLFVVQFDARRCYASAKPEGNALRETNN